MNKYWILFVLELKSVLKSVPKILLISILFFLVGGFAIYGVNRYSAASVKEKSSIALVYEGEADTYTQMAFSFIRNMDTVKNLCSFEEMDKDTALTLLEAGELEAVILLPESMVESIFNGTNTPAKIIFPRNGNFIQSQTFKELIHAGCLDLSVAQSGIYAVSDFLNSYEADGYLNAEYMSYVLKRDSLFTKNIVSATGDLDTFEFYIATIAVILMMFFSIYAMDCLKREHTAFRECLKIRRISLIAFNCIKIFCATLIFYILYVVTFSYLGYLTLKGAALMLLCLFSVFSLMSLIYHIAGNETFGAMIIFAFAIASAFICGGIIPFAFLPDIFEKISVLIPATYFLEGMRQVISGAVTLGTVAALLFISTLCIVLISTTGAKARD